MPVRLDSQQIVDVAAFGEQHQVRSRQTAKKWNQHFCQISHMVKSETVEHLAHVEAYVAGGVGNGPVNLPEHGVIVDVDLDKRLPFAIHKSQIAVCAMVGTTIGDRNQLMVRPAGNARSQRTIELLHKG